MVDITSVLSLQGRARRNARSSLRVLRIKRAAALKARALLDESGGPSRADGAPVGDGTSGRGRP